MQVQKEKMEETICGVFRFSRGLAAEEILGATNSPGELCYLIKWLVFSY